MQNEIGNRIRNFISLSFPNNKLQDNEDIFSAGFVTSLFAMQLVLFIEGEFGIAIGKEDLVIDNFRTIEAMILLVDRKTKITSSDLRARS